MFTDLVRKIRGDIPENIVAMVKSMIADIVLIN